MTLFIPSFYQPSRLISGFLANSHSDADEDGSHHTCKHGYLVTGMRKVAKVETATNERVVTVKNVTMWSAGLRTGF